MSDPCSTPLLISAVQVTASTAKVQGTHRQLMGEFSPQIACLFLWLRRHGLARRIGFGKPQGPTGRGRAPVIWEVPASVTLTFAATANATPTSQEVKP